MKKLIIDPPSGWKYGFPMEMPMNTEDPMAWLIEQGYPEKLIESFGKHFYYRCWYEEEQNDAT